MSGGHDAKEGVAVRRSARTWRAPRWCALFAVLAALLFGLASPSVALGCTVCANPSLEAAADGLARRSQHRLELSFLMGSTRAGDTEADDKRIELVYAFAPIKRLELSLAVPLLVRTLVTRNAPTKTVPVPGDVEVAATGTLWSFREKTFSEAFSLRGGVKLPSAPAERDAHGVFLSSALQPGCNSVTPDLALAYSFRSKIWAFTGDGSLYFPIAVRTAPHAGASIRSSAFFEIAPSKSIALRAGLATRLDPTGELRSDVADENSGGFVGSIVDELVVKPVPALEIAGAVYSPVLQFLHGDQHIGTTFGARVAWRP